MGTINGNLLDSKGIIVHGCNCKGVMGGGIALAVRNKWPEVFRLYAKHHEVVGLKLGTIQVVKLADDLIVINAMTQDDFGTEKVQADYNAIRACFKEVRMVAELTGLPVGYPLIGCGLAGGDWNIVSKIIEEEMQGMEHNLFIYDPKSNS